MRAGLHAARVVLLLAMVPMVSEEAGATAVEGQYTLDLSERPGHRGPWSITPTDLRGPNPGETIAVTITNTGNTVHNLTIEGHPQGSVEELLAPGDERTLTFGVPKVGRFPFWCAVPGHRAQGMEGQLIVGRFPTGPSAAPGLSESVAIVAFALVALGHARRVPEPRRLCPGLRSRAPGPERRDE